MGRMTTSGVEGREDDSEPLIYPSNVAATGENNAHFVAESLEEEDEYSFGKANEERPRLPTPPPHSKAVSFGDGAGAEPILPPPKQFHAHAKPRPTLRRRSSVKSASSGAAAPGAGAASERRRTSVPVATVVPPPGLGYEHVQQNISYASGNVVRNLRNNHFSEPLVSKCYTSESDKCDSKEFSKKQSYFREDSDVSNNKSQNLVGFGRSSVDPASCRTTSFLLNGGDYLISGNASSPNVPAMVKSSRDHGKNILVHGLYLYVLYYLSLVLRTSDLHDTRWRFFFGLARGQCGDFPEILSNHRRFLTHSDDCHNVNLHDVFWGLDGNIQMKRPSSWHHSRILLNDFEGLVVVISAMRQPQ